MASSELTTCDGKALLSRVASKNVLSIFCDLEPDGHRIYIGDDERRCRPILDADAFPLVRTKLHSTAFIPRNGKDGRLGGVVSVGNKPSSSGDRYQFSIR